VTVLWLTAFVDRPAADVQAAVRFWTRVTETTLSPTRGDRGQFATFVPAASGGGDAFLRVQTSLVGCDPGHLDVHVADVEAESARAVALGALAVPRDRYVTLTSPAGLRWCLVPGRPGSRRPAPIGRPDGSTSLVDQLCLDVPPAHWDIECAFWQAVTGWELHPGSRPEFAYLVRPGDIPLRLLLHRLNDPSVTGRASCHLDLACSNVATEAALHQEWGARILGRYPNWTTLADPTGAPYCITRRDPTTGTLPR
jgi:hypothetical protein